MGSWTDEIKKPWPRVEICFRLHSTERCLSTLFIGAAGQKTIKSKYYIDNRREHRLHKSAEPDLPVCECVCVHPNQRKATRLSWVVKVKQTSDKLHACRDSAVRIETARWQDYSSPSVALLCVIRCDIPPLPRCSAAGLLKRPINSTFRPFHKNRWSRSNSC